MKKMKRLTDPRFKYVRSEHTDIRVTIERARRQILREAGGKLRVVRVP